MLACQTSRLIDEKKRLLVLWDGVVVRAFSRRLVQP